MGILQPSTSLRQSLRQATEQAHDQLDSTMRAVSGWSSIADYSRFLSLQHAARTPVEALRAAHAPDHQRPPPQTPLIASDLDRLGEPLPTACPSFDLPGDDASAASDCIR